MDEGVPIGRSIPEGLFSPTSSVIKKVKIMSYKYKMPKPIICIKYDSEIQSKIQSKIYLNRVFSDNLRYTSIFQVISRGLIIV